MPGYTKRRDKYFNITKATENQDPVVEEYVPNGDNITHGSFHGQICGIIPYMDEYRNRPWPKFKFLFLPPENGNQYEILEVGQDTSVGRSLIMTLFSSPNPVETIDITPYKTHKDGEVYKDVWVEVNGEKVEWNKEMLASMPDKKNESDDRRRQWLLKLWKRVIDQNLAVIDMDHHWNKQLFGAEQLQNTDSHHAHGQTADQASAGGSQPDGRRDAQNMYDNPPAAASDAKQSAQSPDQAAAQNQPTPSRQTNASPPDLSDINDIDDDLPF